MIYVLYIGILIFSLLQSASVKLYNRTDNDVVAFNFIKSLTACAVLLIMNFNNFFLHIPTIVYGTFYGILLATSMNFGYKALASGPMSMTSLIVSFSVIIPILYGLGFCGESLTVLKIIGMVSLCIAMIFTNMKQIPTVQEKDRFWRIYVALTFLSNGFCSVIQKMHQIKYPDKYCEEFTFAAMIICAVCFAVLYICNKKTKITSKKYAVYSGVSVVGVSFLTMKISGAENASVIFPAITAGTICSSLLVGALIFKEKLKTNHIVAMVCGIAAVVFLKL